jgi:L-serine dehydratase
MNKFSTFKDLLAYCEEAHCSIGEAALDYEESLGERSREEILTGVRTILTQMRATIKSGLYSDEKSLSGLSGGASKKMMNFKDSPQAFMSPLFHNMMAYALATLEENSRMRKIVACPTAGASGVVPSVLIALSDERSIPSDVLEKSLLAAGMVGEIVSKRMFLSGAAAGCQAEVGVATGMAAAAIVECLGGTPPQAIDATAIAFKNLMGLVCDPIAGLVEVPCVKRNSVAGVHAAAAATIALSGISSFVPADEVVEAMVSVGKLMSPKLKESAEGGLAKTPTAVAFTENLRQKQQASREDNLPQ